MKLSSRQIGVWSYFFMVVSEIKKYNVTNMGPQREEKNRPRSRNLAKTMKRPVSSPPGGSALSVRHITRPNTAKPPLMD